MNHWQSFPEENRGKRMHMYYFQNMITCVFQRSWIFQFGLKNGAYKHGQFFNATQIFSWDQTVAIPGETGLFLGCTAVNTFIAQGFCDLSKVDIGVPHPLNVGPYGADCDNNTYIHTLPQVSYICFLRLNELRHYKPERGQCNRDLLSTFVWTHNATGRGFNLV